MSGFASFDAFSKSKSHVKVRTLGGATVSLVAATCMLLLTISEVSYWRTTRVEDHLFVDKMQADRDFNIVLDFSFHALACKDVSVVSEDNKGVPYDASRTKVTLTPLGGGAGCRMSGFVTVKHLPGHLSVAAPRVLTNVDGRLAFTVPPELLDAFNASHDIHRLSFGPAFPGQVSPLEGTSTAPVGGAAAYQYHLRVVPTVYETVRGVFTDSQQYSASDFVQVHDSGAGAFVHPGVWLRYDFSPIAVRRVEVRRGFLQFLTSLCAILGGVFALSGLVDQLLHRAVLEAKSK